MSQLAQGEVQCLNSSGEGEATHWKDSSSHSVDKSFVEPLSLQQATRISQSSLVYQNTSMSAEQTLPSTCSQSANCSVLSPDQKLSRSFSNRLLQHSNSFSDDIFASLSTALSTVHTAVADNNSDANSTSHSVAHQDGNSSFINNCSSSSFRERNYQPSVAPDFGSTYEKNSFESGIADVVTDQLGLSSEAPSFESGISMQSGDALSRHYQQTYGTHLDKNSIDNSVLQPDQKYSQSPHFIQREFIENQNVYGSTPINSRVQLSSTNNQSCVLKDSFSNTMPSSIAVTPKPALRRRSRSENRSSSSNIPEEGTPQRRRNTAESIFRSSQQENSLQSRGSSGQINTSINRLSHSSLPRQASRCNSQSQIHNSRSQIHNSPSQIHNSPSQIHNSRSQVHDSPNHQIYDSSLHYGHGSPALARSTESTVTLGSTLDSSVGNRSSSNLMDGGPPPHVARVIRTASYPRDLLTPQRLKWVCWTLFTPKRLEFVRLLVNVKFSIPLLLWKNVYFQN